MSPESRIKTIANPKSCFLDLSYTSGNSPSRIERILTDYFEGRGFEVKTGRMAPGGEPNDSGILQVIKSCSFGIVVYNEFRHNIGYEWGLLDALGMPVIPFKDKNTHIDFDKDFSDKKGINFVQYSGDSDKKDIIEELKNSESLKAALENVERRISERISPEETEAVREISRLLTESNISLRGITTDKEGRVIIDIAKTLETAFSEVKKLTAEGHFYRANTYYYSGDFENAEKEFEEVLKLNPDYAEAHSNLGNLLQELGRNEEAEREYREAIRSNSGLAEVHNNLGNLLQKLERYKDAEREYKVAIRINPNLAEAHYNLGNLLQKLERYKEAEREYKVVIRIKPDYAEAHYNLGYLSQKLERYKTAEREYREAIGINPDYAEAHSYLGFLLDNLKRYEEAESEYREAIQLNPDDAEAHSNLGDLLRGLEKYEEAEEELKEAIKINPDLAEAHGNLGILYSETEREEEARIELETARGLFEEQGRAEGVRIVEKLLKSL